MRVYLIDGTYELFRGFFGAPAAEVNGHPVGAVRALVRSLAAWLRTGTVTHAGVAFDHVIESFRNELFVGYKTGEGMDPELYAQFPLAERAAAALGLTVWPMVEFEADDALATAAAQLAREPHVTQILLTSPDKDLAQCVQGDHIVAFDRHRDVMLNTSGVISKFGVPPGAIADYLALVGDSADGIPGIAGWGAKSAATMLTRWGSIEAIPPDHTQWDIAVRGAAKLASALNTDRAAALLYKRLATLRTDCPIDASLSTLAWRPPSRAQLAPICAELGIAPESLKLADIKPRESDLDGPSM